jgi:menaquinone-9 beta-reductase
MERRPLIIVGAGPAGAATALYLHRLAPQLAAETLILEKARHPRPKVCAGGLIPHVLDCMRELDLELTVPHVVVDHARVSVPRRCVSYSGRALCRVVRRDEFDHLLAGACRERGVTVREAEKVLVARREPDGVRVETDRGSYVARALVGADGSGSLVRRQLIGLDREHVGKAMMCDVPAAELTWSGLHEARYDFDFTPVAAGLRGYAWAFPCLIGGIAHANLGVYSVDAQGRGAQLARLLQAQMRARGSLGVPFKSFPIRWYGRGTRVAAPRVLLAGDAAGVDALMGEGISFAFEYGRRAAYAAERALARNDFEFADYERAVADSWLGRKLRRLEWASRLFYGPTARWWFAVAAHSRRAQDIGIRWYNGTDGWDRRSGWEAVRAWLGGALGPVPPSRS